MFHKDVIRVGLVTTLNTNIGDDLIRTGIVRALQGMLPSDRVEFVPVNKHEPLTVYEEWHPARWSPRGRFRLARWLSRFGLSRFDQCDLIIQCGAPVLWPNCHVCEWAGPLWDQVIGRLSGDVAVLNLAAGSCYPWERQPDRVPEVTDAEYLRRIAGYCATTTVRDQLAESLYRDLGCDVQRIPCSALLSAPDMDSSEGERDLVLINYMTAGGHYDWDQQIDADLWEGTVRTLIGRLSKRHRVAFLCHDQREYELAGRLDPSIARIWPRDPDEYFRLVSRCKVAICNRMHASVALASLGIPSVAVCTDSRLLMVAELDLPIVYVKEADAGYLESLTEALLQSADTERERLHVLKETTWKAYERVLAPWLPSI